MAIFHVVENNLYSEKKAKDIVAEKSRKEKKTGTRKMTPLALNDTAPEATAPGKNFSPIGIGKPLSIEIATVYTGTYRRFLGSKKDVIVVSGVKNSQTFQAASRAINSIKSKASENDFLKFEAFTDGTKVVYYSPSMDSESMVVSFEIMFDNFNSKLFTVISGLLSTAAGIPVFMPAAPYLIGGSQLINIGSKIGDAVFSGKPTLSGTINVQFDSPVLSPTQPREFVIYNNKDKAEFNNLKVAVVNVGGNDELRLVNKTDDAVYEGDAPYMIVLLDGRKRSDLDSFSPTIASSAILSKFYGASDKETAVTGALQEAMQLYNDSVYRVKGEKLKKQLEKAPKDSEEYKKLKTLYQAYADNITTEGFKLPDPPEGAK